MNTSVQVKHSSRSPQNIPSARKKKARSRHGSKEPGNTTTILNCSLLDDELNEKEDDHGVARRLIAQDFDYADADMMSGGDAKSTDDRRQVKIQNWQLQ